jgi:hypothetical protein
MIPPLLNVSIPHPLSILLLQRENFARLLIAIFRKSCSLLQPIGDLDGVDMNQNIKHNYEAHLIYKTMTESHLTLDV